MCRKNINLIAVGVTGRKRFYKNTSIYREGPSLYFYHSLHYITWDRKWFWRAPGLPCPPYSTAETVHSTTWATGCGCGPGVGWAEWRNSSFSHALGEHTGPNKCDHLLLILLLCWKHLIELSQEGCCTNNKNDCLSPHQLTEVADEKQVIKFADIVLHD